MQTSGTQVSVASMSLPMQEAVDKEIRQHALKALQVLTFLAVSAQHYKN